MKDYVNVAKPTASKVWWARHGVDVRAIGFIIAIALIGSIGV